MKSFLKIIFIISLCAGIVPFMNYCKKETETPTDQNQELINTALKDYPTVSAQTLNQIEYDLIQLLREQGGGRTALGDQADTIFQQIERAKVASMEDIRVQAITLATLALNESPMPSLTGKSVKMSGSRFYLKGDPTERMAATLGTLVSTPVLLENARRDVNGNIILPKIESEQTRGAATLRSSLQLKMLGSKLEAQVEMIANITEPIAYEERTIGTMSMEICPDAQGNVPQTFSFHSGVALNGGGQQLGSEGQAIGHVSDEGKLANYDAQCKSWGARQPIQGAGDNWGTTNKYYEFTLGYTGGSITNPDFSNLDSDITRASSEVDQKFINQTFPILGVMNLIMPMIAFWAAEMLWTKGYCVAIQVPEMGESNEKSVMFNSETPFTAIVKHKFENTELNVPVIAKLTDGKVSVSPAESKVNAPANFTYKAPDTKDQTATVNLETVSKRGIGKMDIKFKTRGKSWKIIDIPPGTTTVTSGLMCDLIYPFTIQQADNGEIVTWTFAPSSSEAGSFSANVGIPGVSWEGTYTINVANPDTAQILLTGKSCVPTDMGIVCVDMVYMFLLEPLNTSECDK